MNQAKEITRRCVERISVLLPFKDEVCILDAVNEAISVGRNEAIEFCLVRVNEFYNKEKSTNQTKT